MTVYVQTYKHALEQQAAILNELQQAIDAMSCDDEVAQVAEATALPAPKVSDFEPYDEEAHNAAKLSSASSRQSSSSSSSSSSVTSSAKTLRGFLRKKLTSSSSGSSITSSSAGAQNADADASSSSSSTAAAAAASAADQKMSNAHFGVPLEVLTKREGTNLPSVLKHLVEQSIKHGGTHTRGIFRLAADKNFLQTFTSKADNEGVFIEIEEPIDAGQLIKNWLRALPEPIIPNTLYEEIMKPGQALTTFEKLEEPNKTVVGFVIKFLQFMNRPMFVSETMMGASNLASMFAPCLIRCPYHDLSKSLFAAEKESTFVEDLIGQLDTDRFPSFDTIDQSVRPPPVAQEEQSADDIGPPPPSVSPITPEPPPIASPILTEPEYTELSSPSSSPQPQPAPDPPALDRPHPPPVLVAPKGRALPSAPDAKSPVQPPPPMPIPSSNSGSPSPQPSPSSTEVTAVSRQCPPPRPRSTIHLNVDKVRNQISQIRTSNTVEDATASDDDGEIDTPTMDAPEPPLESPRGDAPEPPAEV